MKPEVERKSETEAAGREAARRGYEYTDNPHPDESMESEWWEDGWFEEFDEIERERNQR